MIRGIVILSLLVCCWAAVSEGSPTSALEFGADVHVVLAGFGGENGYPRGFEGFGSILEEMMPNITLNCADTKEVLRAVVKPAFTVSEWEDLEEFERAVVNSMTHVTDSHFQATYGDAMPQFAVEIEKLAKSLDSMHERAVNEQRGQGTVVLILRPDKDRVLRLMKVSADSKIKTAAEGIESSEGFVYAYSSGGSGGTQSFIAEQRAVVIDISAGPCRYGESDVSEGTITEDTIPRITAAMRNITFPRINRHYKKWGRSDSRDRGPVFDNEEEAQMDAAFMAKLSAVLARTVRSVVVPDVAFTSSEVADRILIPVLVFRDHSLFNPLVSGHAFSLDMAAIRDVATRLAFPGQDVSVVSGVHSLHDHSHIAVALAHATRARTSYEAVFGGKYNRYQFDHVTRTFVDAPSLVHEIRRAADVLTAGLLSASEQSAFFGRTAPAPSSAEPASSPTPPGDTTTPPADAAPGDRPDSSHTHGHDDEDVPRACGVQLGEAGDSFDWREWALGDGDGEGEGEGEDPGVDRGGSTDSDLPPSVRGQGPSTPTSASASNGPGAGAGADAQDGFMPLQGTWILPVYVLSLMETPDLPVIKGKDGSLSLVAATKDFVVVLQSNHSSVPLSAFAGDEIAKVDARDSSRHVIAGLVHSLGNVLSPVEQYSSLHRRLRNDHLFATGLHPFGALSNSKTVSQLFVDHALRNHVVSRASRAHRMAQDVVVDIDEFAKKYLFVSVRRIMSEESSSQSIHDQVHDTLVRQSQQDAPGEVQQALRTIQRLQDRLEQFESKFHSLSEALRAFDHSEEHRRHVHDLSSQLLYYSSVFRQYARRELRAAKHQLSCCTIVADPVIPMSSLGYVAMFLVFSFFFVACLNVLWRRCHFG